MKFPKISGLGVKLLAVLLIPALFYICWCQSILKSHFKTEVTNDPKMGLTQSLSSLRLSMGQQSQSIFLKASQIAQNEKLKTALTPPAAKLSKFKTLGRDFSGSYQTPLLLIVNKNGGVLYDTLDLALPTPSPTAPKSNKKTQKTPAKPVKKTQWPPLFQAKSWPGLAGALKGFGSTGLFFYNDRIYQAASVPLLIQQKVAGAILAGVPWDSFLMDKFKADGQNNVVFYSNKKIQFSTFPAGTNPEVEKALSASNPGPCVLQSQNYLWDQVSVADLSQNPAGTLAVFQPSKQARLVEGAPEKIVWKMGLWLLVFLLAAGIGLSLHLTLPLREMISAVERIRDGGRGPILPVQRLDEWGSLGKALREMSESLLEKDRISLILGKVLSPQAAKKVLSEKDYFALKGERRECAILHADLRGFSLLSENMEPAVLVGALNQYFTLINEIVFKHEGMLDKFIGETAVAIWGAPFSPEDKEKKAALAALEIQEAVKEFNIKRIKKGAPPFTIGIGIHTGTVVSGNLGSESCTNYSVIGEPLHLAARLCSIAAPGQIIVSAETLDKIKTLIQSRPLSPIAVKGAQEPLTIYEIFSRGE